MSERAMLPEAFSELEPFAAIWCIPDANERYDRRLASSMDELEAFYRAVVERAGEIMDHLRTRDPADMDDASTNLMWLMCSLSTVGFAVDVFKQPMIPDTCGARMPWIETPYP